MALKDLGMASRVGIAVLACTLLLLVKMYAFPRRPPPPLRAVPPEGWSVLSVAKRSSLDGLPPGIESVVRKNQVVASDRRVSPPTTLFIAHVDPVPAVISEAFLETYARDLDRTLTVPIVIDSKTLPTVEGVRVARFLAHGSTVARAMLVYIVPLGDEQRAFLMFACAPRELDGYLPALEAAVAATIRLSR